MESSESETPHPATLRRSRVGQGTTREERACPALESAGQNRVGFGEGRPEHDAVLESAASTPPGLGEDRVYDPAGLLEAGRTPHLTLSRLLFPQRAGRSPRDRSARSLFNTVHRPNPNERRTSAALVRPAATASIARRWWSIIPAATAPASIVAASARSRIERPVSR